MGFGVESVLNVKAGLGDRVNLVGIMEENMFERRK